MRYTNVKHNLDSAAKALEVLADTSPKRNLAEELANLKPQIKIALAKGHKPSAIAKTLKASGVSASMDAIAKHVTSLVPKPRKKADDIASRVSSPSSDGLGGCL